MSAITSNHHLFHNLNLTPPTPPPPPPQMLYPSFSDQIHFQKPLLGFTVAGKKSYRLRFLHIVNGVRGHVSAWDEKPYEILPSGTISYLDEQDVITFLDPPKELIPLDSSTYNPAAYLWKKIEDIPEERRLRLLKLLKPRLISRAWEVSGARYENPKLMQKSVLNLLSNEDDEKPLAFYNCRTSGGPWPLSWFNFFKQAIFRCDKGNLYGRFIGGYVLKKFADSFSPLYFTVRGLREVMSTEQPCDLAFEFGDGLLGLDQYPQGFPKPVKHLYPFDDQVVIYIRHVGPGVLVGQAWQEGKELQQVPRKLCNEILMINDYSGS